MKFLDRLKISVKMLGVLTLLGLVTAFLIVDGGRKMAEVNNEYSGLIEGIAPARVEFARSSHSLTEMALFAYQLVDTAHEPEKANELARRIDEYYDQAAASLRQAGELNPSNVVIYSEFLQVYTEIHGMLQEVIQAGLKLEVEKARQDMMAVNARLTEVSQLVADFNNRLQLEMVATRVKTSAEVAKTTMTNYIVGASALIVSFLLGLWISIFKISRPLSRIAERMGVLANGDLEVEIEGQTRGDEIGAMARAVQVFKDNAIALKTAEAEAEAQRRAADEERARNAARQEEIARQTAEVVNGLGMGLERLARGDLTYRVDEDWAEEYVKIKEDFNDAIGKLQDTIKNIMASSSEVSSAAAEISSSTTDLSQRTEEQAASLEETSASMEEISVMVKQNATNAQHANGLTQSARAVAEEGGQVVSEVVAAMSRIDESSRKISDIITVIDEIARQTNLLALNAAVEAARAGEAGRGFAVVAQEVRSLAQRSSQAARDIAALIVNSTTQVEEGVALANKAGSSLSAILQSVNSVAEIVSEIANACAEQATGIDQINQTLSQMDEMTQRNSALVEENAATARSLEEQQAAMSERVGYFRIDEDAAIAGEAEREESDELEPAPRPAYRPVLRDDLAVAV